MYVLLYLGVFILELFLLALLSKRVMGAFSRLVYRIFRSRNTTVNLFAVLFLPGTIIHELSHLFAAGLMLVPVGEIDIFPKSQADGSIKLGSVQIAQTDPFRRLLIGVAPVIFGNLILAAIIYLTKDSLGVNAAWWVNLLVLYAVFELSNTMFASKKDMEGSLAFLGIILVVILIFVSLGYLLGVRIELVAIENFRLPLLESFLQTLNLYLIFPLALNLLIYLPFKILGK